MPLDRLFVERDFFTEAEQLRSVYDEFFSKPAEEGRSPYIWRYHNIPGFTTVMLTPADEFFPPDLYARFADRLLSYGRRKLGLNVLSEPYLSFYIPGMRLELHNDVNNGSWGFVYSLTTSWGKSLAGGETLIVNDDYWLSGGSLHVKGGIATDIPPIFNQLLVFDDRVMHAVRPVQNRSTDAREARVAIHGHLRDGGHFVEGALSLEQVDETLERSFPLLNEQIADFADVDGLFSIRLTVAASGRGEKVERLLDTVRRVAPDASDPSALTGLIESFVHRLEFPRAEGSSEVTIPFPISFDHE